MEVSWLQLIVSAAAAVTSAWILSSLGVAGTLIGAAVGSIVVTLSSAFYSRSLDHGRTLILQTERGTVVEATEPEPDPGERRLHWRTITVTVLVVLGLALAAISAYELVSGRTLSGEDGTTIGHTVGGGGGQPAPTEPTPTEPSVTEPTPAPTEPTPTEVTPSPTEASPTPTASEPTATPVPVE